MDERELQAFLDQLMKESAEKHGVPLKYTEAAPEPEQPEPEPEPMPEPHAAALAPEPEAAVPEEPEPADFAEEAVPVQPERRHPVRDPIVGAILVILSLVGIAALVQTGISLGKRCFAEQPDPLPDALCRAVLPLVLIDQPDFDEPEALTDDQFLSAAVISLMTGQRLAGYPDNLGMRVVPAADIAAAGEQLFGTMRTPEYRTFGIGGEVRCYYDREQDSYLIPASSRLFTYEPKVTEYRTEGDTVTANVEYYAEQPAWQTGAAEYIKTVEYTLRRAGDVWQIRAAQQVGGSSDEP